MDKSALEVRALHNHIIIKPDALPEKSGAGLILSKPVAMKLKEVGTNIIWGAVAAVGPGLRFPVPNGFTTVPCDVKIGERVMYNRKFALEVIMHDEEFHIITENHIVCAE